MSVDDVVGNVREEPPVNAGNRITDILSGLRELPYKMACKLLGIKIQEYTMPPQPHEEVLTPDASGEHYSPLPPLRIKVLTPEEKERLRQAAKEMAERDAQDEANMRTEFHTGIRRNVYVGPNTNLMENYIGSWWHRPQCYDILSAIP